MAKPLFSSCALLTVLVLALSAPAFSDCVVVVASAVAPTDGGAPPPFPAQIVPNIAGTPANMPVGATDATPSELLMVDDNTLPNCFGFSQRITVNFGLTMTSPASLTAASVNNLTVYDSSGSLVIVPASITGTNSSQGTLTTITLDVIHPGASGDPRLGPGSGVLLRNLKFNTQNVGPSQFYATISTSQAGSRFAVPTSVAIGNLTTTGPLTLSSTYVQFLTQLVGATSNPPKSLTLTNAGTLPITFTSVVASTEFSQTNTCGSELAVAATCQLNITFTPADVGVRTGTVTITGNTSINPYIITVTGTGVASPGVPTIRQISPAQAISGGPSFTLTVSGSNFVPGSTVLWNNLPRPTFFGDSSTVSAAIPASDLLGTGTASITVQNAGSGASNALSLQILPNPLPAGAYSYALPHIISGAGFVTKITLINRAAQPNAVTLNYLSPSGALVQSNSYSIAPLGTLRVATPEANRFAAPATQWAAVGAQAPLGINVFFELTDATGKQVLNTIGFNDATPETDFSIPVEFQPNVPGPGFGRTVGLALANYSDTSNPITLQVVDSLGSPLASYSLNLAPFNQTAIDLSTLAQITAALPAANFVGTLTVSGKQPLAAIALGDDMGPFAATPPAVGRANLKVGDIASICPAAAEVARFNRDLVLSFEADPTAGTAACRQAEGSANLTPLQLKAYQALRVMKAAAFDVPLPFSTKDLYDWMTGSIAGIRFRGDIGTSFCCEPARTINIAVGSGFPALQADGWLGSAALNVNTGLDDIPSTIVRLARISEGFPDTCTTIPGNDQTISELGPWAALLDLYHYTAFRSASFFDDTVAGDGVDRYRTVAASNETSLVTGGRFCGAIATEVQPQVLNFGTQPVGGAAVRTVLVSAGTGTPFTMAGANISGFNASDYSIVSNDCQSNAVPPSCSVTVAFKPAAPGGSFSTLFVGISGQPAPIPVPLNGFGGSATPVPATNHTYVLPHIVTGQGYVTKITITNLADVSNDAVLTYVSQSGAVVQRSSYTLGAGGAVRIATPEQDRFGPPTTQWAIVGSREPVSVNLFFEIMDASSKITNTVGFNAAPALTSFVFPVEFQPAAAGALIGRTAGLALANPSALAMTFTMTLLDGGGNTLATETRALPAYGQTAFDLTAVASFQAVLPATNFVGSVRVQASAPVSAIALEDDIGPFSATPVIPLP